MKAFVGFLGLALLLTAARGVAASDAPAGDSPGAWSKTWHVQNSDGRGIHLSVDSGAPAVTLGTVPVKIPEPPVAARRRSPARVEITVCNATFPHASYRPISRLPLV